MIGHETKQKNSKVNSEKPKGNIWQFCKVHSAMNSSRDVKFCLNLFCGFSELFREMLNNFEEFHNKQISGKLLNYNYLPH